MEGSEGEWGFVWKGKGNSAYKKPEAERRREPRNEGSTARRANKPWAYFSRPVPSFLPSFLAFTFALRYLALPCLACWYAYYIILCIGPDGYQQQLPFTCVPTADIWVRLFFFSIH